MKLFINKVHTSIKGKRCDLHICLRHTMRLARYAGAFPVEGLGYPTAAETRYKLKSVYGLYFCSLLIGQITLTLCSLHWHTKNSASLKSISILLFFSTSLISSLLLQTLAKRWSKLMETAAEIEESLSEMRITKFTAKKINVISYIIMVLAVVEHLCSLNFKISFEQLLSSRFYYVFNILPYNIWIGYLFTWLTLQATIVWVFADLLTICFSTYITAHFDNINKAITIARNKTSTRWGDLRAHYSRLVLLVQEINRHISGFILLSLFTNLIFICMQMFNSLHALTSPTSLIFYLYSFLFLIVRTLMMYLCAANVHSAAQRPIVALFDIPASVYDMEVKRFQYQIQYTTVGLCGYFFIVTRSMILKVISTIITYELVLLQFNRPGNKNATLIDEQNGVYNVSNTVPPAN